MAQPADLIGSRISLISNKDIRYEGVLFAINAAESSLTLRNVRCYGTEGRGGTGQTEWKPDDRVYDYVMFNAGDIKDLHVHDGPQKSGESASTANGAGAPSPEKAHAPAPPPPPATKTAASSPPPAPPQQRQQQQRRQQTGGQATSSSVEQQQGGRHGGRGRGGGYHNRRRDQEGALPGSGTHLLGRRGKFDSSGKGPEGLDEEFDFETANQGFNKEEELAKLKITGGDGGAAEEDEQQKPKQEVAAAVKVVEAPKYNPKASFFDDLSSGTGSEGRVSGAEERRVNIDTFGMAALHHPRRFRGGRGGFRGGGRGLGGYRGGGGGRGGRGGGRRSTYGQRPQQVTTSA